MISDTVQARISHDLKEQAEKVLSDIGLKTSDAIRIFLQQCVNVGGLPFQPMAKKPNAKTMKSIKNIKEGKNLTTYKNIDELFASWDQDI